MQWSTSHQGNLKVIKLSNNSKKCWNYWVINGNYWVINGNYLEIYGNFWVINGNYWVINGN